jgi:hypothetical protein
LNGRDVNWSCWIACLLQCLSRADAHTLIMSLNMVMPPFRAALALGCSAVLIRSCTRT